MRGWSTSQKYVQNPLVPDVAQIGFVWLFELFKAVNDIKI